MRKNLIVSAFYLVALRGQLHQMVRTVTPLIVVRNKIAAYRRSRKKDRRWRQANASREADSGDPAEPDLVFA